MGLFDGLWAAGLALVIAGAAISLVAGTLGSVIVMTGVLSMAAPILLPLLAAVGYLVVTSFGAADDAGTQTQVRTAAPPRERDDTGEQHRGRAQIDLDTTTIEDYRR